MGKYKTCVSKGDKKIRVLNEELQSYLDNGWVIGWGDSFKESISKGLYKTYQDLKDKGLWEEYKSKVYTKERNEKISISGKLFWDTEATEEYILNREEKKKESRDNWTEEERKFYINKMSESAKKERANKTKEEWDALNSKAFQTKKKNHTFNTSKPAEESYKLLLDKFNEEDIIREYSESRYPFRCDFYVKSLDLFIECNYHYTHGPHKFNPSNKEDLILLENIRSKQGYLKNGNKNSYFVYEEVWTVKDINKYEYALKNNLNYIAVYSFDEFLEKVYNEI